MIEARGLVKRYGSTIAVDNLGFDVMPGTVTGFLGPNGAGKSTTMRMMLGLDRPTAGDVRIDGQHYDRLKDPLKYIGALLDAKAMFSSSLEDLRQALFEYSIPNQLSVFYSTSLSDSGPSGWDPLWIALGATAVVLGGAFALLEKRDV